MSDRFMKKAPQPRLTTEEEELKNKLLLNELKALFSKISEKFTNTDYETEYHKEHNKLFAIMYLAKPFSHKEMMQLAEIIGNDRFEYNLATGSEDIIKKGRFAKLEICFVENLIDRLAIIVGHEVFEVVGGSAASLLQIQADRFLPVPRHEIETVSVKREVVVAKVEKRVDTNEVFNRTKLYNLVENVQYPSLVGV